MAQPELESTMADPPPRAEDELAETTHHVRSYPLEPGPPIAELPPPPKATAPKPKPESAPRPMRRAVQKPAGGDMALKWGLAVLIGLVVLVAIFLVVEIATSL